MPEFQKIDINKVSEQLNQSKVAQTVATPVATIAGIKENKHWVLKSLLIIVAVAGGLLAGWGVNLVSAQRQLSATGSTRGGVEADAALKVGDIIGVDEKSGKFPDTTEGVVEQGGMEGEGSHKLLRPGGPSQTVYLTSSVVDLDQFVGTRIKVWGETFAAQKAGWLMDVGRVQILELNAPTPEGN